MPVNKMLIETYMKKLKMPQVAKTYESLAEKPQTIIWIMKNTCCVCWNRKYISGRITGSREGSGKQAFLLSND